MLILKNAGQKNTPHNLPGQNTLSIMLIRKLTFILFLLACYTAYGQDCKVVYTLDLPIRFRQGSSILEPNYQENAISLDTLASRLLSLRRDTSYRIRIVGSTSPEGSLKLNERLARRRAGNLASWFDSSGRFQFMTFDMRGEGVAWDILADYVEASDVAHKEEVLDILRHTPEWEIRNGQFVESRKQQLRLLHNGECWQYLEKHFFPAMRSARVELHFKDVPLACARNRVDTLVIYQRDTVVVFHRDTITVVRTDTELSAPQQPKSPFYMALKTNLLYDAALIPNIGAEFYLGQGWTIGGNWMYAWWKSDKRHRYWRIYGGELDVRKYFGARAKIKPLTGHHVGLYAQMLTYDFEIGGRGYIGGKPGGTLCDKMNWGIGLEYGYSLPIARRLNLDFSVGLGYIGGECWEYEPINQYYVWKETKYRHWFGPTKAKISLVWLIGRGNWNGKKGNKQ